MDYRPDDELPHSPGDDPDWQESVWVSWYDDRAGIGGLHRIGHEPHQERANVWCGVLTDDGVRFRRVAGGVALTARDRTGGFGAGAGQFLRVGERPCLEVSEPGLELTLAFHDFHPMVDYWTLRAAGTVTDDFAPRHFEASGRVVGTVRLAARTYEVDGLAHRDHSWGVRRWDTLLCHRWCAGTLGPALSFSGVTWVGTDGSMTTGGYVVRDGEPAPATEVDIVVHLEADGLTHRGGEATFVLPGGERVAVGCLLVDGMVFGHRDYVGVDTVCRAVNEDRWGFCDLEVSNNSRNGRQPPPVALRACMIDGLSHRARRGNKERGAI